MFARLGARVHRTDAFLRLDAGVSHTLKVQPFGDEMTTSNTRRNDVIDWLNDAYAMERSLEVMLRL